MDAAPSINNWVSLFRLELTDVLKRHSISFTSPTFRNDENCTRKYRKSDNNAQIDKFSQGTQLDGTT